LSFNYYIGFFILNESKIYENDLQIILDKYHLVLTTSLRIPLFPYRIHPSPKLTMKPTDFKSVTDLVAMHVLVRIFMQQHKTENEPLAGEHQSDDFATFEEEETVFTDSELTLPEENRRSQVEFEAKDGLELSRWLRRYFED